MRTILICLPILLGLGCKDIQKSPSIVQEKSEVLTIKYARGFSMNDMGDHIMIYLKNPWPGADKTFSYAIHKKEFDGANKEIQECGTLMLNMDAHVDAPVNSIVVTSTTHIPSLDMLGVTDKLIGFPNRDYISSEKARQLIENGRIKELGQNEAINTEVLIDLNPDVVVGFAVDGANTTFSTIKKTGIPVLYNSDWTETHPLGKAEWIKFFGVLFGKQQEADSIFRKIEMDYLEAKELAQKVSHRPTVLSGAMYKDVWYMPQGNSWAAQFITDAGGEYLWKDSAGTGSLSMNLESVLEKGRNADFWIGPGQFSSKEQFREAHSVYAEFDALKNGNVYTFTAHKGETGGVIYYELAGNRPDLVLKDIIKILHPELLSDYKLYFFTKVD